MRILQLVHSLDRGGAERVVLEFDRGAKALGHQMCVTMLLDSNAFTEPQYASVETRFLVSREQYHWPRYVLPASARLRDIIAKWKPDVLFTHTPDVAIVAAWAQPKFPAVEVIHWYWDTSSGSALREAWRRAVSRWAFSRNGRRGILVAPHLLEDSSRNLGCAAGRFRCVENGVDLERFVFVPREGTDAPRIIIVGALNAFKRPDLGLRAFTHLRKELPEARLVLAGDGPMRTDLETLCRELCLGDSVDFLGYRADLPEVLAGCHVCWHVSRSEGFGLAVAEAMANGLPVVGMDVPGVRDLLAEWNAGLLVPESDPVALADRTIRLLRDNMLFLRIARAGRLLAEDRFDVRRMVAGYLEVASEIVTGCW
jgi:glycosyltransferase involved in cell wall biosynthesis